MRFGYSTNAFVKFSLFEAVDKIAALGFPGIEIMCDRPHLYPPDFDGEALTRLSALLDRHRLSVTNLNSFTLFAVGDTYLPSWIEADESRRAIRLRHTRDCLKVARFLKCRNISVPPGGPWTERDRTPALILFRQGLEKVLPEAEALGIKILVEPEPDLLVESADQFKAFIRDFRSPCLGLNFDVGHFFCVGEDPVAAFEDLFPWIGHVHLEDIAASRVHNHLIAGEGVLPFLAFFRTLSRLGYEGDISLELYPYVDRPEEAGRASLLYLRPIFQESGLVIDLPKF